MRRPLMTAEVNTTLYYSQHISVFILISGHALISGQPLLIHQMAPLVHFVLLNSNRQVAPHIDSAFTTGARSYICISRRIWSLK